MIFGLRISTFNIQATQIIYSLRKLLEIGRLQSPLSFRSAQLTIWPLLRHNLANGTKRPAFLTMSQSGTAIR